MRIGIGKQGAALVAAAAIAAGGLRADEETQAKKPGKEAEIASVANFRDVGGIKVAGGKTVKKGALYRSGHFGRTSPADLEKLAALGLKSDFDLRTPPERMAFPDRMPAAVKEVSCNLMGDADAKLTIKLAKLLANPKAASEAQGEERAQAIIARIYRDFVAKPGARRELRKFYLGLVAEGGLPAVVHCTSGKDRTGWATAALLAFLGAPREAIAADYLRTNDYVLPSQRKTLDAFVASGGDKEIGETILGVKAANLDAAFDEVAKEYGTIEEYFAKGLELDESVRRALREKLLAPSE